MLALDLERGDDRALIDRERLLDALCALLVADLIFAGAVRSDGTQLELLASMPIAHPLLNEAAKRLSRSGRNLALNDALSLLRGHARGWKRRLSRSLAARDILEVQVPFPFMRRYRLRSRQAWNESVAMLQSIASDDGSRELDRAFVLLLATQHCGLLAEVVDAASARQLRAHVQPQDSAGDAEPGQRQALQQLFARS